MSIFNSVIQLSRGIAHRGASALAPENTLAAFQKAHEIGAKWVEFDVMLSSDGEAVIMHDETLDRTTNGSGNVCDYPYSYLQTLDAGSWFDPAFSGEKIPTFSQVLEYVCRVGMAANIEIKPQPGREVQTVKKVLDVMKQYEQMNQKSWLVSSFSSTVLETVRKYDRSQPMGYLMHEWESDWQQSADALNCVTVHLNHENVTSDRVSEIHATNRLVLSYTVDHPALARKLLSEGVDSIFTNCSPGMEVFL